MRVDVALRDAPVRHRREDGGNVVLVVACDEHIIAREHRQHRGLAVRVLLHRVHRQIVRDHDAAKFQQKLELMDAAAALLNQRLGEERVTVEIKQQYRNMAEIVRDYPELIDVAKEAYLACGIEPQVLPIRGGTDGAQLSFRGLPCPNLSTGGYCYHGVNEFVPVSSLVKMTDVLQELVARFA